MCLCASQEAYIAVSQEEFSCHEPVDLVTPCCFYCKSEGHLIKLGVQML